MGFRVEGLGWVQAVGLGDLGLGFGFSVEGLGCRVQALGLEDLVLGFGV